MNCYIKNYPRPQLVRKNWENLNGCWDFSFDDQNLGEKERWYEEFPKEQTIQVPFTYETKMSGIGDETPHDQVWYHKTIDINSSVLNENRVLLHFEGSDYYTKVWVNGRFAGEHEGGYERFSFDITDLVNEGENEVSVRVWDSFDTQQPRGKQRWIKENFACWYVQTTGIWKTVWMEYVPQISLAKVKMTPNLQKGAIELEYTLAYPQNIDPAGLEVEAEISFKEERIAKSRVNVPKNPTTVSVDLNLVDRTEPWGLHLWSPQNPALYDVVFRIYYDEKVQDEVGSYFGMREIRIDGSQILLNGNPLYQRLILDQGYWEDSHLTPPSEEALIEDIDKIHELGYNGLRKHQKIEDERFLYWCDVKGMLVWSEMAATYFYSDQAVSRFTKEWLDIVEQNYNHPSIITWTPFNESWGISKVKTERKQQHFTESIYHLTKSIDAMRPVIVNDGWEHTISDILTLHDYEEAGELLRKRYVEFKDEILRDEIYHSRDRSALANGYHYSGQPVIISEFGGIAFTKDTQGWGYGNKVESEDDFVKRFDAITTSIKEIPYVCGYCYTQVTDVQQEVNGLMDMKRNFKVDPARIREVNERPVAYWRRDA